MLRYHQGTYYLVTTLMRRTESKILGERSVNFIVTATEAAVYEGDKRLGGGRWRWTVPSRSN